MQGNLIPPRSFNATSKIVNQLDFKPNTSSLTRPVRPATKVLISDPITALDELRRCTKRLEALSLGRQPPNTNTIYGGENLWPVFEEALDLDIPIYIYPFPLHSGQCYRPLTWELQ
jgi:predicted TIM-barrel fold metal-dependent hydrolase